MQLGQGFRKRIGRSGLVAAMAAVILAPVSMSATAITASAADPTFSDDFNGTQLNPDNWEARWWVSDSRIDCPQSGPDNISVHDGYLHLTVRRAETPVVCQYGWPAVYTTPYTSGNVQTAHQFAQAYGRFEIRAAFPASTRPGVHSALWMWPTTGSPLWQEGGTQAYGHHEIDIAEFRTGFADRSVAPAVHLRAKDTWQNNGGTPGDTSDDGTTVHGDDRDYAYKRCLVPQGSPTPEQFHTYAAEWTPDTITFLYDGAVCLRVDWDPELPMAKPQPFDDKFFITLTNWLSLEPGNTFTEGVTELPATMKIDYVRVWA